MLCPMVTRSHYQLLVISEGLGAALDAEHFG